MSASASGWPGPGSTAATTSRCAIWLGWPRPAARGDDDSVRAVIGHLARAGVLAPAAGAARPRRRAASPAAGTAGPPALCVSSAREAERVRWAQYRAVWEYVEGDALPAAAAAGPLRRSLAGCARGRLLRRVRARGLVPAPAPAVALRGDTRAAAPGARRAAHRRRPATRRAIVDVVVSARPPVGRTRAVEILRGGRSKVVAQYAYDALAGYGALRAPALRRGAGPRRRAARGRAAALHRRAVPEAPRGMNVGVLASGAGTNLQALIDRVARPRRRRDRRRGLRQAGRDGAGARPRGRASPPHVFPLGETGDRDARDAAIAGLAARARRRAGRAGRLHAAAQPRLPGRLPRRA